MGGRWICGLIIGTHLALWLRYWQKGLSTILACRRLLKLVISSMEGIGLSILKFLQRTLAADGLQKMAVTTWPPLGKLSEITSPWLVGQELFGFLQPLWNTVLSPRWITSTSFVQPIYFSSLGSFNPKCVVPVEKPLKLGITCSLIANSREAYGFSSCKKLLVFAKLETGAKKLIGSLSGAKGKIFFRSF